MNLRVVLTLLALFMIGIPAAFAQGNKDAVIFHIQSSHTSFPDTGRMKGHKYDSVVYTTAEHYHDSTVLIIAPKNLDAKKTVDLVFWFHGWRNNVDNAAVFYHLTEQFIASHRNAVLVLAETAKDSPDSYGGKLENPGVFKALVGDVLKGLKDQKLIPNNCTPGHILIGGHSGAYRVMAYIIQNGQMPIDEVMLFDALYAETDKFMAWIKADKTHRFIDLYTDHGGTDGETHDMVKLLNEQHIPNIETEETQLTPRQLQANRLVYIHSLHEHNNIVNSPDNFRLFLENAAFLGVVK